MNDPALLLIFKEAMYAFYLWTLEPLNYFGVAILTAVSMFFVSGFIMERSGSKLDEGLVVLIFVASACWFLIPFIGFLVIVFMVIGTCAYHVFSFIHLLGASLSKRLKKKA